MKEQNIEIKYIPLSNTQDEIRKIFIKTLKGNMLIYNRYKDINITPLYIPCNVYSYDANGFMDLKCTKEQVWKSQNYKYTKSDIYSVNREAKGKVYNVIISCSKEFDSNELIESYDYKKLKVINDNKALEYKIAKGNKTKSSINTESIEKAKNIFKEEIKDRVLGYDLIEEDKSSILLNNENINHVLLPVWLVEISQNNNIEKIYINGQNNKIIYKFKPNKYRLFILWIVLFILTLLVLFLFNFLR